ncbi:54S ribosomal protein L7, mitochondrial [Gnomoniopsis smithogilvyi]|uniref:54S ribosomal protein L7, mitochondrial n=1 Tax=Gnomoniopsis smithogilvyi TaxID=1191159 RepID=A0A9W9CUZ5_9PEZI|nr:54S ribosomal protein L7, mitochondrial [Gnomoniopsis smithogilvyi]
MTSWREVARPLRQLRTQQISRPSAPVCARRRWYSAEAAAAAPPPVVESPLQDVEAESSLAAPGPTTEQLEKYREPWKRAQNRKYQLPANRYQYHPPKFHRGPLHPIQSPPSSDPIARDFQPGPFYYPRLKETLRSTIAPDLLTLTYIHKPPGQQGEEPIGQRLRSWDGSSPYHKNRPLRGPRGGTTLRPVERDISFHNIPEILSITMSVYQPQGIKDPTYLLAARTALQAVTGAKPEIRRVRRGVSQWGVAKGQLAGAKATVWGEQAYELLDKMIHLVFPRIKEWPGISVATGDESGNIGFGFSPDEMALFPEIQVNYDSYPPKTIPGCRVNVVTTATSDRQARLLMQAMGIPFHDNKE